MASHWIFPHSSIFLDRPAPIGEKTNFSHGINASNLTVVTINGVPPSSYVTNGGFVIQVTGGATQTVVNGGSITIASSSGGSGGSGASTNHAEYAASSN